MMKFRTICEAVRRILEDNAGGEFRVIGAQSAGKDAESTADNDRTVEVFYTHGDFPASGGSGSGPNRHEMVVMIGLTASKASEGDTAILEDPGSSAAERSIALRQMKESSALADESFDQLVETVYQIVMDARNNELGLAAGDIEGRWISDISKDEPKWWGNYTVISGFLRLNCVANEAVLGYRPIEITPVIDVDVQLSTDEPGKAGVQVGE
jgi:hypothetical protein